MATSQEGMFFGLAGQKWITRRKWRHECRETVEEDGIDIEERVRRMAEGDPDCGQLTTRLQRRRLQEKGSMSEHPNVTRHWRGYEAFSKAETSDGSKHSGR